MLKPLSWSLRLVLQTSATPYVPVLGPLGQCFALVIVVECGRRKASVCYATTYCRHRISPRWFLSPKRSGPRFFYLFIAASQPKATFRVPTPGLKKLSPSNKNMDNCNAGDSSNGNGGDNSNKSPLGPRGASGCTNLRMPLQAPFFGRLVASTFHKRRVVMEQVSEGERGGNLRRVGRNWSQVS